MNPWDAFTWFSAVSLATSAVLIFAFFARDARSILERDMHEHHDAPEPGPPEAAATTAESTEDAERATSVESE
jgi:hypothetical protein